MQGRLIFASALLVTTVLGAAGCARGTATTVRRDPYGGVLALHGPEVRARRVAGAMMQDHCRGPFEILGEQRVVVGQQTRSTMAGQYQEAYDPNVDHGTATAQATTQTGDVTELQVTYRCAQAAQIVMVQPQTESQ